MPFKRLQHLYNLMRYILHLIAHPADPPTTMPFKRLQDLYNLIRHILQLVTGPFANTIQRLRERLSQIPFLNLLLHHQPTSKYLVDREARSQPKLDEKEKRRVFFDLPAEVRNEIYAYVLIYPPSTLLFVAHPPVVNLWEEYNTVPYSMSHGVEPPLCRVNKQLRAEAMPFYLSNNCFTFLQYQLIAREVPRHMAEKIVGMRRVRWMGPMSAENDEDGDHEDEDNDNEDDLKNWLRLGFQVKIIGPSCGHTVSEDDERTGMMNGLNILEVLKAYNTAVVRDEAVDEQKIALLERSLPQGFCRLGVEDGPVWTDALGDDDVDGEDIDKAFLMLPKWETDLVLMCGTHGPEVERTRAKEREELERAKMANSSTAET
ncbi:hypothetical protein K402DRAFT_459387 [Aulographum hederae CBS 113979]|uniref:Uncharacterized protein n=1 Tax=Aulographum hederae CBS 113979 TaxID=1176131 RepID=A0A6G1HEK5_9PEZI|nr:hypothetical protein K402DRAFT_459387 [Aulographum hederae CBS 113979]